MKNTLRLLLLFGISISSFSQSVFHPTYGSFDLAGRRFVINEIIDARPDKNLGFIEYDSLKSEKLIFEKKIDEILLPFIERCSGEIPKKPMDITIKINTYKIGTRKVNEDIWVWLYFDLEFFLKNEDNYIKIYSINNIVEGKGEKNTYLLLGKTHWAFWRSIISNLNNINPKKMKIDASYLYQSITNEYKLLPPIFYDSTLNEGVYWSYSDFLNNNPNEAISYQYEKNDKTEKLLVKDEKGKFVEVKKVDEYWGFSKNNIVYICVPDANYNPKFVPIERFGNTFEIATELKPNFTSISDKLVQATSHNLFLAINHIKPFGLPVPASLGFAVGGILLSSLMENPSPRPYLAIKEGKLVIAKLYRF